MLQRRVKKELGVLGGMGTSDHRPVTSLSCRDDDVYTRNFRNGSVKTQILVVTEFITSLLPVDSFSASSTTCEWSPSLSIFKCLSLYITMSECMSESATVSMTSNDRVSLACFWSPESVDSAPSSFVNLVRN